MTSQMQTYRKNNPNDSNSTTMLKNSQYQLQNCLTKNSVYQIYQAINLKSNQPVIIYTLSPHLHSYPEFHHWKKQFFYYILLLKSCHHSSLPKILDCFEKAGHPYLVYEDYSGISLEQIINQKQQSLTPQEIIKYIKQIIQVLNVLHQKGLVHQNINPRHILIDQKTDQIKLINFGFHFNLTPKIAKLYPDLLNDGFSPLEHYQLTEKITPATDIYSLSAIFFYLLTGKKPLSAPQRNKISWTDWQTFSPQFPESIRQALLKGLSINIENRCQTLEQWFTLMTNYSGNNSHPNHPIKQSEIINSTMSQNSQNIRFTNITIEPINHNEQVILTNQSINSEDNNYTQKSTTSVLNPPIINNPINNNNFVVNSPVKSVSNEVQSNIKIKSKNQPKIQQKRGKLLSHHYYELKELIKFMLMTGLVAASGGFGFACSFAVNKSEAQSNKQTTTILHNEQTFPPRQDWPIQTDPQYN